MLTRALLAFSLLGVAGCGSTDTTTMPDSAALADLSTVPDLAPPPADLTGACTIKANVAPPIMVMQVASAVPTAMGGPMIPDGTYWVTAHTFYTGVGGATGPTGKTENGTNYISGSNYEYMINSGSGDQRSTGTFMLNMNKVVIKQGCPSAATSPYTDYDSDTSKITIYAPALNPPQSVTFTKQ